MSFVLSSVVCGVGNICSVTSVDLRGSSVVSGGKRTEWVTLGEGGQEDREAARVNKTRQPPRITHRLFLFTRTLTIKGSTTTQNCLQPASLKNIFQ